MLFFHYFNFFGYDHKVGQVSEAGDSGGEACGDQAMTSRTFSKPSRVG